jgi:hypothetical protein
LAVRTSGWITLIQNAKVLSVKGYETLVEIEYVPNKKLLIHEIIEQDNQTFFEDLIRQALANPTPAQVEPSVNWFDGLAFYYGQYPPTEDMVKESLEGRIHYAVVFFTRIDFRPQFQLRLGGHDLSARIHKADSNPIMVELAKFLQTFKR